MTLSKTAFAVAIGCGIVLGALSSADAARGRHHMIGHSHKGFSSTKRPGRTTPAAVGPGGAGEMGPASGSVGR
jgi:hypothetical protein